MKTVYFTASLSGKQSYSKNHFELVRILKKLGFEVFADHILRPDAREYLENLSDSERKVNYKEMVALCRKSDLVVAEVSCSSTSVGLDVANALEMGKSVVLLHVRGKRSLMYEGKNDDKLQVVEYELEDLYQVLKDAVEYAFKKVDVRFNFFISPKQLAFLNRIAKDKGIPRSAYIRNLLDVEMMREGK